MKFIYACDIHGDESKYNKILETAIKEKIKYIVLGGDLYPKNGERTVIQPEFINNGLKLFFEKLKENNLKCILILGNDDLEQFDEQFDNLCSKYENIYNVDKLKTTVEDICFIGLSNVLDAPFKRKNRVLIENNFEGEAQWSDEILIEKGTKTITAKEWERYRETNIQKMEDVLARLPKADDGLKSIYILHEPPFGIGLDVCFTGKKVGSKAITKFIEEHDIYMSLHGHIHESPEKSGKWKEKIGNTICIQPGQTDLGAEKMMYVIINTDNDIQERFEVTIKE